MVEHMRTPSTMMAQMDLIVASKSVVGIIQLEVVYRQEPRSSCKRREE